MNKTVFTSILSASLMTATGATLFASNAVAQTWTHEGQPAQLVELFTSEGCSSCPPADRFLSKFQSSAKLWKDIIPVAFHVDYWDYLGWKDEFAHPAYSQRQRLYRAYGSLSSVYTPGFVVDGNEWRGFFSRSQLPAREVNDRGALTLNKEGDSFRLNYDQNGRYTAHLVLLAMDERTKIAAGENRGRELEHDFVVLNKYQLTSEKKWNFNDVMVANNADAVAVWLTKGNQSQPVQTVAGYFQ
ncbi:DUF1223 domain-containing protein [Vibrio nigripulchritudo]|uniref:DUF1223 domain-containing protein n=1 Tax=Vibrio nigripulchritudo TaxID=28173 RepID=UPI0030903E2A|nr:hypothetical protein TUMSATVNIG3_50760 [Vibrio nigripulchritudo]